MFNNPWMGKGAKKFHSLKSCCFHHNITFKIKKSCSLSESQSPRGKSREISNFQRDFLLCLAVGDF